MRQGPQLPIAVAMHYVEIKVRTTTHAVTTTSARNCIITLSQFYAVAVRSTVPSDGDFVQTALLTSHHRSRFQTSLRLLRFMRARPRGDASVLAKPSFCHTSRRRRLTLLPSTTEGDLPHLPLPWVGDPSPCRRPSPPPYLRPFGCSPVPRRRHWLHEYPRVDEPRTTTFVRTTMPRNREPALYIINSQPPTNLLSPIDLPTLMTFSSTCRFLEPVFPRVRAGEGRRDDAEQ
jgi:hypothetical protein